MKENPTQSRKDAESQGNDNNLRRRVFAMPISRHRRALRRFFRQCSGTGVSPVCFSKVAARYKNTQARRLCHFACGEGRAMPLR